MHSWLQFNSHTWDNNVWVQRGTQDITDEFHVIPRKYRKVGQTCSIRVEKYRVITSLACSVPSCFHWLALDCMLWWHYSYKADCLVSQCMSCLYIILGLGAYLFIFWFPVFSEISDWNISKHVVHENFKRRSSTANQEHHRYCGRLSPNRIWLAGESHPECKLN